MISRSLRFFLSHPKHLNVSEITSKMTDLRKNLKIAEEQLVKIKLEVKQKEAHTAEKNKAIHEKRVRLTQDVKKSELVWENAKKKSEANKSEAIHSFAASLIQLGNHFNETKQHQKEQHGVDLKQGFENTARLFFNTLEKFKIKKIEIGEGSKVKKEQIQVVGEEKGQAKDTVFKVVQVGWEVEGKVIRKPKVILVV